ncbi:carbohydrate sulfotransferase [Reticulomyxa filosa]|uniref:Carbohydrate sulfotransferase n=1 Tax=Reticulomyxa filosa TaxID=46433 RepID=X6PAP1_RETFI|nr:carbohydrate sulfotransferase [Reticulomyxa filosa]|eukprot:ETO35198.1 carbohydrate sulfotransferase [Reticulomyxa filosa]
MSQKKKQFMMVCLVFGKPLCILLILIVGMLRFYNDFRGQTIATDSLEAVSEGQAEMMKVSPPTGQIQQHQEQRRGEQEKDRVQLHASVFEGKHVRQKRSLSTRNELEKVLIERCEQVLASSPGRELQISGGLKNSELLALQHVIIDRKNKVLYCKIMKNSCTKFSNLMWLLSDERRDNQGFNIHRRVLPFAKTCKQYIRLLLDPQWKSFVVLRSPWERLLSAYLHLCLNKTRLYDSIDS